MIITRGAIDDLVMADGRTAVVALDELMAERPPDPKLHRPNRFQRTLVRLASAFLREVRTFFLQTREVSGRHIAGDVFAREARRIELMNLRIMMQTSAHEIVEILIDQAVGA